MFRRSFLVLVVFIFCIPSVAKENYQRTEPIHITREGQRWAERTLARLTVQEKVGQLFMLRAPTEFFNVANTQYAALRDRVRDTFTDHLDALIEQTIEEEPQQNVKPVRHEAA